MPNTYKKIASVVVGSGGTSAINFTSIPQTFTDLKIVFSTRANRSGEQVDLARITFNDSNSNYSRRDLYGDYTAAYSSSSSGASSYLPQGFSPASSATANVFSNNEIYISNYTSSNFKSISSDIVTENNSGTANYGYLTISAGLWSDTSAITKITITNHIGTGFSQHTTATLYGIGDVPSKFAKAVGGMITTDSTYVYHTFTSSHVFIPNQNLTVDYLVVAGGGGGGAGNGAGGGAGGLRCTVGATGGGGSLETPLSLTASTSYTVTVGAGGIGGTSNGQGANGSNSSFSTITSIGGGGGGAYDAGPDVPGKTGGSGGGGGTNSAQSTPAGSGTANQGYAGGVGNSTNLTAGGGGGAGGVGTAGNGTVPGIGGNGVTTSIFGISTAYAGGGGGAGNGTGAAGGTGGGGAGSNTSPVAGTAFTGGGGGGKSTGGDGAAGGSGIVIVRYLR
jgi:hypothetical protein